MADVVELRPCPFCGGREDSVKITHNGLSEATITCKCGVVFTKRYMHERYVLIGDDIYRRIPPKSAADQAIEGWNRRADNG